MESTDERWREGLEGEAFVDEIRKGGGKDRKRRTDREEETKTRLEREEKWGEEKSL